MRRRSLCGRALGITFLSLVLLYVLCISRCFRVQSRDREEYDHLVNKSVSLRNVAPYTASQYKRRVRKDLFFLSDERKRHVALEAEESVLRLCRGKECTELLEEMKGVTCLMQEELLYLGDRKAQRLRRCVAKEAVYSYHTGLFSAQEVYLNSYIASGHALEEAHPITPLTEGVAKSVEFSLSGKETGFLVHHLKASFQQSTP